jgi:hypothetical protein
LAIGGLKEAIDLIGAPRVTQSTPEAGIAKTLGDLREDLEMSIRTGLGHE